MFTECIFDPHGLGLKGAIGAANGPPLVFLHGVLRGWHDFAPLFAAVQPRWQPVAVDFRGHGRMPGPPANIESSIMWKTPWRSSPTSTSRR